MSTYRTVSLKGIRSYNNSSRAVLKNKITIEYATKRNM